MGTVSRLRAMQSGQATQRYARSLHAVQQAEQALAAQQAIYEHVLEHCLNQQVSGLVLDPAQHEQRLQALLGLRARLAMQQAQLREAEAAHHTNTQALTEARTREHLAAKALEAAEQALARHWLAQELIDVFDAQQAGGAGYGV